MRIRDNFSATSRTTAVSFEHSGFSARPAAVGKSGIEEGLLFLGQQEYRFRFSSLPNDKLSKRDECMILDSGAG